MMTNCFCHSLAQECIPSIRTGETIPPIPQRNHVNGKILIDLSAKKIYTNNVFSREPTNPLILTF